MGQGDFTRSRDREPGGGGRTPAAVGERAVVALPLAEIEEAIRGVRHGTVQIIIQDGVVVQIDRTEKRRLR
jgi:hypothetical protein